MNLIMYDELKLKILINTTKLKLILIV